ncbi:hypothetical protein E4582_08890 [Luteimonas yindakuii]|uniref:Uncharacterized protein n=1 Tax=Luteimonas yindakuii TaxID=2565782 RepID=A0A4Z1RFC0_9GAMM|nr:hypothetical protein [Luteimonas yindakuii]TKS54863.1 hypothetical protein E4582_08890 [Luteimonas yindakuii]
MQRNRSRVSAAGFYIAIALIAYALIGALSNNLYLPGKYSRGLYLHEDAIPPALLGIVLFALLFPLSHFRDSAWLRRARVVLKVGAALSMLACLYVIANPSGRRLATTAECQQTFRKLAHFAGEMSGDGHVQAWLAERSSQCASAPILASYHHCIARAQQPAETNDCARQAEDLFQRDNATRPKRMR